MTRNSMIKSQNKNKKLEVYNVRMRDLEKVLATVVVVPSVVMFRSSA